MDFRQMVSRYLKQPDKLDQERILSYLDSNRMLPADWEGVEELLYNSRSAKVHCLAWLACVALPSRRAETPQLPEVFLDTTGAWSAYLKRGPIRRLFHNAGFGLGLSWQVLEGLDVFGGLQVTNSFQDPFGDLLRDFWTVRLSAGVGYSVRFRWGRVYLHTGLLFDHLSDFAATTDVRCKFWPERSDLCPASRVQQPRWMLGWMAAPGVEIRMIGPLQLVVRVGVGAHFVANDLARSLNFPVQVELGLGYAFPVRHRGSR